MSETPEPARVLSLISELNFGGDENRLLTFSRHVDPAEIRHTVVTVRDIPDDAKSLKPEFHKSGIPVLNLGSTEGFSFSGAMSPWGLSKRWSLYKTLSRRLIELIEEHRIQLISGHDQAASFLALRAAKSTGIKTLQTLYHHGGWNTAWKRLPGKYALSRAHGLVTDSQIRAREIEAWVGGKCPPISVIPNGVLPPQAERTRDEILEIFDLKERPEVIVGTLGRLVPFKGQHLLLEAAAKILKDHSSVVFLIVGFEGPPGYTDTLRAKAQELGIADHVRIAGYAGNVGDVWSLFDIYAHPSLFDSLPNALLEGMSLGVPIAASRVGGIPEMIEDNVSGLLFTPNDVDALAESLERLLTDEPLRSTLSKNALNTYRERCTPQVMTQKLQTLMQHTLKK